MSCHRCFHLLRIFLILLISITIAVDGKEDSSTATTHVFDWLQNDSTFFLSSKLEYIDGNFRAKEGIKQSEVLMEIPSSYVMVAPETDDDEDLLCELLHSLWKETELGDESAYAPYIRYLEAAQSNRGLIPVLWSNIGRRLLNMVSITLPRKHITSWIDGFDDCFEALKKDSCDANDTENCKAPDLEEEKIDNQDSEDEGIAEDGSLIPEEVDALEYSDEHKAHLKAFDIAIQHQIDRRFLVPLYDQIQHHHYYYNVNHTIQADNSIKVVALRDIDAGENLLRQTLTCLSECDGTKKDSVTSAMRNFGRVENYPQFWNFPVGVSFVYDPANEEEPVQWFKKPFEYWNVEIMENEYRRQLRVREREINKSRQSIPDAEWRQIDAYSFSLVRALQVTISDANEMFDENGNLKEGIAKEEKAEAEGNEDKIEEDKGQENEEEEKSEGEDEEDEPQEPIIGEENEEEEDESDEFLCDNACFELGVPTNAPGCDEEECFLGNIADLRGCPKYRYNAILNETEWVLMRSAYIAVVGPKNATIELTYKSGMKVPFRVGYSPGRGRGVFSVEDIKKGTLVWTSEHTAAFETGLQYRTFLRALPAHMVCDLLIWCYTARDKGSVHYIGCDLDEGSLFNTYDERAEYNVGGLKGSQVDYKANEHIYAVRDITAGEELVTAYGSFDTDDFAAFGL